MKVSTKYGLQDIYGMHGICMYETLRIYRYYAGMLISFIENSCSSKRFCLVFRPPFPMYYSEMNSRIIEKLINKNPKANINFESSVCFVSCILSAAQLMFEAVKRALTRWKVFHCDVKTSHHTLTSPLRI